jgi:hypothetical protein
VKKSPFGNFEYSAIVGICISVAVTTVFYFAAGTKAELAAVMVMIGIAISLIAELLGRMRQEVSLRASLEKVDWLLPVLSDLARSAEALSGNERLAPFEVVARQRIDQTSLYLNQVASGSISMPAGDLSVSIHMMKTVKSRILATSVGPISLTWWETPYGQHYWQSNLDAMARSVIIERFFIHDFTRGPDQLAALKHQIAWQLEAGVDVYVADTANVPAELRRDTILWDNLCMMEVQSSQDGVEIGLTYSVARNAVGDCAARFERLRQHSQRITTASIDTLSTPPVYNAVPSAPWRSSDQSRARADLDVGFASVTAEARSLPGPISPGENGHTVG